MSADSLESRKRTPEKYKKATTPNPLKIVKQLVTETHLDTIQSVERQASSYSVPKQKNRYGHVITTIKTCNKMYRQSNVLQCNRLKSDLRAINEFIIATSTATTTLVANTP